MIAEPSCLVYSENRSGPSTEPWGIPVSRKQGLDKEPFHMTWKVQFDVNQARAKSTMPSSARVERRIWWLTVSNAGDKSRRLRMRLWRHRGTHSLWGAPSPQLGTWSAGYIIKAFKRPTVTSVEYVTLVCWIDCYLVHAFMSLWNEFCDNNPFQLASVNLFVTQYLQINNIPINFSCTLSLCAC